MMPPSETESLIRKLAREAGPQRGPAALGFDRLFLGAATLSLAVAVGLVAILAGVRPDFATMVGRAPFLFKLASTLALAGGGVALARRAARPGEGLPVAVLAPGVLLLLFRAVTDRSGLSWTGNSDVSPVGCVSTILLASMPALALLLGAFRTGAPTRPGLAGGIAGLLAGALGAAAYTIACKNDAGLFVLIWYPLAILLTAALGAVIGRRALAW